MAPKNPFGPESMTVQRHTKFSIQTATGEYYRVNAPLTLEQFTDATTYSVSGFVSAKGNKYINQIEGAPVVGNTPVVNKPLPPPATQVPHMDHTSTIQVPDKPVIKRSVATTSHTRDFVKEAKGKTFSLIISALVTGRGKDISFDCTEVLQAADLLLKGIEERGYF